MYHFGAKSWQYHVNHGSTTVGCKIVAQVLCESSLVKNTTHGNRAVVGAYTGMGADASTDSIHVYVFKTKTVQLFSY
jgi:hypothetical protein